MTPKNLVSAYDMPGYKAIGYIQEYREKSNTRLVTLRRIQKKQDVPNSRAVIIPFMIERPESYAIYHAENYPFTLKSR